MQKWKRVNKTRGGGETREERLKWRDKERERGRTPWCTLQWIIVMSNDRLKAPASRDCGDKDRATWKVTELVELSIDSACLYRPFTRPNLHTRQDKEWWRAGTRVKEATRAHRSTPLVIYDRVNLPDNNIRDSWWVRLPWREAHCFTLKWWRYHWYHWCTTDLICHTWSCYVLLIWWVCILITTFLCSIFLKAFPLPQGKIYGLVLDPDIVQELLLLMIWGVKKMMWHI